MAAENDPRPLPRPEPGPAESHSERIRDAWVRIGSHARALLSPAMVSPALAFVAVAVVGILAWTRMGATPPPPLEVSLPTVDPAALVPPAGATEPPEPSMLVVHVAGAVVRPGVYRLPAGARVGEALDLAGGATPEADLDRINLAAEVFDGAQVHVPRFGQALAGTAMPSNGGAGLGGGGPIDLNTADGALLETLPGVGPSTAAAIIAHREDHGPFPSVAALDEVSGIGPARLDALRDLVTVGGAP